MLIRGSERLRFVASVILTIAGLVILDESIPHPGPFAQAPLLIDTILLGVVAVLTCVCLDLIRFGGHLPKGGYDVRNGRDTQPTAPSAIHG